MLVCYISTALDSLLSLLPNLILSTNASVLVQIYVDSINLSSSPLLVFLMPILSQTKSLMENFFSYGIKCKNENVSQFPKFEISKKWTNIKFSSNHISSKVVMITGHTKELTYVHYFFFFAFTKGKKKHKIII